MYKIVSNWVKKLLKQESGVPSFAWLMRYAGYLYFVNEYNLFCYTDLTIATIKL